MRPGYKNKEKNTEFMRSPKKTADRPTGKSTVRPAGKPLRGTSKKAGGAGRVRKTLWRLILLLLLALAGYELYVAGMIVYWRSHTPGPSSFMEARLAQMRLTDPEVQLQQAWVPYARISPSLKRAVIASEDSKFVSHHGFDWDGIKAALNQDLEAGEAVRGGSTITQQLAKNAFLSASRTPWRKAQEAIATVMFEHLLSKHRIYELYLNQIEWGNGIFGAEAAARHYFGVSAAHLSRQQAARLAAMVPAPRYYDRHRNTAWLRKKTSIILARIPMVRIPR